MDYKAKYEKHISTAQTENFTNYTLMHTTFPKGQSQKHY